MSKHIKILSKIKFSFLWTKIVWKAWSNSNILLLSSSIGGLNDVTLRVHRGRALDPPSTSSDQLEVTDSSSSWSLGGE